MIDVFISYARSERALAEPLRRKLEGLGLTTFFDLHSIDGGADFPDVVDKALREARAVLACWSPHYFTRQWCVIESRAGQDGEKLIPVVIERFESARCPVYFRYLNYFDLSGWNGIDEAEGWDRALRSLSKLLNRQIGPSLVGLATGPMSEAHSASTAQVNARMADLRETWRTFSGLDDVERLESFLRHLRVAAPGSGLEFEVQERVAAARQHREFNAALVVRRGEVQETLKVPLLASAPSIRRMNAGIDPFALAPGLGEIATAWVDAHRLDLQRLLDLRQLATSQRFGLAHEEIEELGAIFGRVAPSPVDARLLPLLEPLFAIEFWYEYYEVSGSPGDTFKIGLVQLDTRPFYERAGLQSEGARSLFLVAAKGPLARAEAYDTLSVLGSAAIAP